MSSTTFTGGIKSGKHGSAANVLLSAEISFDPTQTSAGTGFILPKGSVVTGIVSLGGATGGSSPTLYVGNSADEDGYGATVDADTPSAGSVGVLAFIKHTADTEVYVGKGASTATGGTATIALTYYRS